MTSPKSKSFELLPDILTAQNIADYLGISRRRIYELLQLPSDLGGIPNFEIGLSKRVDKRDLMMWVEGKKKV